MGESPIRTTACLVIDGASPADGLSAVLESMRHDDGWQVFLVIKSGEKEIRAKFQSVFPAEELPRANQSVQLHSTLLGVVVAEMRYSSGIAVATFKVGPPSLYTASPKPETQKRPQAH